jgi:predicted  nucleic acid-binding Zn-ribbon protein
MNRTYIRVWQELDLVEVTTHLLVLGDISSICGNCREVGIDLKLESCPKCGAKFKYAATQRPLSPQATKRLRDRRPDLTFIDYEDFKAISERTKARDFFK